ncbi:SDR family oxidoreductase [Nocardioides sp. zg-536]|uniref:SDR family oxidoreductase n=1 Tax=Nocardioides faecalis TaxID=2803858 RepID=A0A938XZ05_9ACTN|nr:SDR family oxidoreductase [Nocardioides faecalis]MBM9459092.1 SDR family oxidoreductase [Nocardioides faecalis]QVI57351.1 SDR family oxidoreductase [Nocardioides faecalis]
MTRPTAVVTGAAAGIGRAIATRLHAAGHLVAAYDVDEPGLARLAEELPGLRTGRLDVRDAEQWRARLAELAEHTGGRLDVLVNNAGILAAGPFADIDLATQQRMVDINVTGVLNGCHTAHPYLRDTPGAHVVNLASASALYGQPELATYSATKFAVRGLTEALDLEWAGDDIAVDAVWPLFVRTAMTEGLDTASSRSLGIRLTPDDVAAEVLDLVRARRSRLRPRSPHHAVGRQAKALMTSSALAPAWLMRTINGRIAGGR